MKREICEKCKHCLSCMCGDEFEDCYIKNPNLKRTITTIVIKNTDLKNLQVAMTKQELLKHILDHYGNVMLLTHDELMHLNKRDIELYLADLQKDESKRICSRN